jgi:hypothetical protein
MEASSEGGALTHRVIRFKVRHLAGLQTKSRGKCRARMNHHLNATCNAYARTRERIVTNPFYDAKGPVAAGGDNSMSERGSARA